MNLNSYRGTKMRPNDAVEQSVIDSCIQKPALARNTDPITSHIAAGNVCKTGRAQAARKLILQFVQANPGYTSAEIAKALGMDRHIPSRRLPELYPHVVKGSVRICRVNGTSMKTWYPR